MTRDVKIVFWVWITAILLFGLWMISSTQVRSSPWLPNANHVRVLTQIILEHSERNYRLPANLQELDHPNLAYLAMDDFIYLAPAGAEIKNLPNNTPLVGSIWGDGMHIGYLGGNVNFQRGGHGAGSPRNLEFHLRLWQIASAVSWVLVVFLILFHRRAAWNA